MNKENYQNKNIITVTPGKKLVLHTTSVSPRPVTSLAQSKSYNFPPNICQVVANKRVPLCSSATHVYLSPLKKRVKKPAVQYGRLWSPDYRVKTERKEANSRFSSPDLLIRTETKDGPPLMLGALQKCY
jgi:hypothetical protein